MKKLLFQLLIALSFCSCDSNEEPSAEETNNDQLKRIELFSSEESEPINIIYFNYINGEVVEIYNEKNTEYSEFEYDENSNLIFTKGYHSTSLSSKVNGETTYVYNDNNELIESRSINDETPEQWENPQSKYYEYSNNNVFVRTDLNSNSHYFYNYSDSNLLLSSGHMFLSNNELIREYTYEYDAFGNVIYFSNEDDSIVVSAKYTSYLKYDIPGFASEKNNPNLYITSIPQLYSNYFLSELTYNQIINSGETFTTNITYSYEFDSENRLTQKTEHTKNNRIADNIITINYYWE